MNPSLKNFLISRLKKLEAESILIVSDTRNESVISKNDLPAQFKFDFLQAQEVDALKAQRYDLGIVVLDKNISTQNGSMLSRLRDVLTRRLIVVAPDMHDAPASNFLALGMIKIDLEHCPDYTIFEYDVAIYKSTPDWLSADGWANPDQWERERW